MKTKEDIYNSIKTNIEKNIPAEWDKAILKINVSFNFSSYKGYYYIKDVECPIKVSNFEYSIDNDLIELHLITTTSKEVERWNIAYFTLFRNGTFEMKYLWDQELFDSVYKDAEKK